MESKLMPCPFCGGNRIGYSDKVTIIRFARKRHVAMYCKDCNCYGARTITYETENYPYRGADGRKLATEAWNRRVNANDK